MIATKAKPRRNSGARNPCAKLDEAKVRSIFLSTKTSKETGREFGVHYIHVNAIWRRERWPLATADLVRPPAPPKAPPTPKPKTPRQTAGRALTPETAAWLKKNAPAMTSVELAFEMEVTEQEARKRCHELGVKWRNGWTNEIPENAREDYRPSPLPAGMAFSTPAGSRKRVLDMRERLEKGLTIWDADDDRRALPRCVAKIQPAPEPVTA